ncbi:MAG: bifunctional phosphopantothenoylcysteine decarboxylase/phosphopantothenate--cysteine ligase CoaBC [Verrucomicrobia bacterium]|nr:bifunctional phosphopantothenoylcysteine decarboxylase/phosphopantothenate--cysteine ligase CoaBC [Verrucomicrobiota bacterium]
MCVSNVLFILTGSIAGYKACAAVSQFVQDGHVVRVVMTEAAQRFVGRATLEGLTGQPVATDLWEPGRAMEHISLTRWADVVVVCPATANTLNKLAAGLGDDLVGALFLARESGQPWLAAPAMNPAMWTHPATVAAVEKLQTWGVRFIEPGRGRTACGETGEGRMAEPENVVAAVEAALAKPAKRLKVLITSGGTAEPIDGVRVLTNTSTGATGARLARYFQRCGHDVTLLRARTAVAAPVREVTFGSYAELAEALRTRLSGGDCDVVIHAAAVGDFRIEAVKVAGEVQPTGRKLDSSAPLTLELAPQPKLLAVLKTWSPRPLMVVGFKLTNGSTREQGRQEALEQMEAGAVDLVVHNDLAEQREGVFPAMIYRRGEVAGVACADRQELAFHLEQLLNPT